MTKSEHNRNVIENFILHITHQNKDEATGIAKSMYESLDDYIDEDHVDGVDGDSEGVSVAKSMLKSAGYFVDNLWSVPDVQSNYLNVNGDEVTDEEAQTILKDTLTNEHTMNEVWGVMRIVAEDCSYFRKKD